ncbi:MAG: thioredoxin domain-containing protein [Gemmatimonadaceae bacterium]|nr:thioredoxin domain-containing protein [Gemmatimonadaceae bacterium]
MPNRLAASVSPYLRQHAENPVDWYEWGEAAFARARAEERPILLSIGYAACHWCHVMAHESFEDAAVAGLMNGWFVNVKVDREERPDVDGIYMQAIQAMSGHGGWPMTVFLTPDGTPFWGGTYFPPTDRHGMPSFRRVLQSVHDAWTTKRDEVLASAGSILSIYEGASAKALAGDPLDAAFLAATTATAARRFDTVNGGFGGAPKFPPTMTLDALLRQWARTGDAQALAMVRTTMAKMTAGGIHDQIGGGFARYAVDAIWLVPHFEKMLYDNALLVRLGTHLWQATHDDDTRATVASTINWLDREMTHADGGWFSSLDADSDGHEGTFYLWTLDELTTLLGADAPIAIAHWGATAGGTFEGKNILFRARPLAEVASALGIALAEAEAAIERARATLYARRAQRNWPARDEKVVTAWNGLMLRGVAEAARVFDNAQWRSMALRNAAFCRDELIREGRIRRSWMDGVVSSVGFLEDAAALALGFIACFELTGDAQWIQHAVALGEHCVRDFWDDEVGAFFDTPHDHERLVARSRDITDNAIPSGTSLAAELMLLVTEHTGDEAWARRGRFVLDASREGMLKYPLAFGHAIGAADLAVHGAIEVAITGPADHPGTSALRSRVSAQYLPSLALAWGDGPHPLLADRARSEPTAWVCHRFTCDAPTSDAAALTAQLTALRHSTISPP